MTMLRTVLALSLAAAGTFGAGLAQAHASPTPRIDAHQALQQSRIVAGAHRGALTPREARALQAQQRQIERLRRHYLADGVLTRAERRHLIALQQQAHRSIVAQSRDGQVRPGLRPPLRPVSAHPHGR